MGLLWPRRKRPSRLFTLADVREPMIEMVCERCGRHGRYNVARLIAAHGADAKLTDLLVTLAN